MSELNIGSNILPSTNHHEPLGERMRIMKYVQQNLHSSFPSQPSIMGIVPTNSAPCITSSCFGSVRRFCVLRNSNASDGNRCYWCSIV